MTLSQFLCLTVYSISLFGFCYIVGHSVITLRFRKWLFSIWSIGKFLVTLLECPACLSAWIGLVLMILPVTKAFLGPATIILPLFSVGSSAIFGLVTGLMNAD